MFGGDELTSTFSEDVEDDAVDAAEQEFKFDPDALKTELDEQDALEEASTHDAFLSLNCTEDGKEPSTRRRSGRPRKPVIKELKISESEDEDEVSPPKRKRGRPPKVNSTRQRKTTPTGRKKSFDKTLKGSGAKRKTESRRPQRTKKKSDPADSSSDESFEGDDGSSNDASKHSKRRVTNRVGAGRRKKISEMSKEERAYWQAKWREETRLRRQRQRERMTPEEREEYLRKGREQVRLRRAKRKAAMTPEELQEYRKRDSERKTGKRAELTEEQKREAAQRDIIRRLERIANMTEEEKAQRKTNNYMRQVAWLSKLTPEELEERKRKRREKLQAKRAPITPEEREERRLKVKEYRANMGPEARARFLQKLKENYRRREERLKAEGRWDEERERRNRQRREYKQLQKEKKAMMNEAYARKLKKKREVNRLKESGMSLEEIQRALETPEERERRLIRRRVNKAKRELRKRLASSGAAPEEIEAQVDLLGVTFQPPSDFRPYKPRKTHSPAKKTESPEAKPGGTPKKPTVNTGPPTTTLAGPSASTITTHTSSPHEDEQKFDQILQSEPEVLQPQLLSSPNFHHQPTNIYQSPPFLCQPPPQMVPSQPCLQGVYNTTGGGMRYQDCAPSSEVGSTASYSLNNAASDYGSCYDATSPLPASPPSSPPPPPPPQVPVIEVYPNMSFPATDHFAPSHSFGMNSLSPPPPVMHSTNPSVPENPKRKRSLGPSKSSTTREAKKPRAGSSPSKLAPRDSVCDECGNYYSAAYLRRHKRNVHSPYYKNGMCTLCNEKIPPRSEYNTHFISKHFGLKILSCPQKTHMCDTCGKTFSSENATKQHWHYAHGPGSLPESSVKCPVCPDKYLKNDLSFKRHWREFHEQKTVTLTCPRCPDTFRREADLTAHVKESHPDSYWPCEYCPTVKYSETTLKFHYSRNCQKMPKEKWKELREEFGHTTLDRLKTPCEFCQKPMPLKTLSRHYLLMHGVTEDKFPCFKCDKLFKRRDYLAAHIVDLHNIQPESWLEQVSKLNVKDREAVQVQNLKGERSNTPFHITKVKEKGLIGTPGRRRRPPKPKEKTDKSKKKARRQKTKPKPSAEKRPRGRPRKVKEQDSNEVTHTVTCKTRKVRKRVKPPSDTEDSELDDEEDVIIKSEVESNVDESEDFVGPNAD